MSFPTEVDVAIVGAGAAGLGAAHALKDSGLSVIILEARKRIGGRAHTLVLADNIFFDEGCGWLHAASLNSFVPIAGKLGFEISKAPPPWETAAAIPSSEGPKGFAEAMGAFYDRLHAGAKKGPDVAADTWLEPGNKWNRALESASTYINGITLDRVSTHDLDAYSATGENWRVKKGYGTLIAAYGAQCPIALDTKVTHVDHSLSPLRLDTSRGTLRAKTAIITLPTDLLAAEAIKFSPTLPQKREAAANLPLGYANKVALALASSGALPEDGYLNVPLDRIDKGAYHLRPFGRPYIEGYFGGIFARDLEKTGVAAQAIEEIVAVMGPDFRKQLRPLHESHWVQDEFARGAYSYALPGHAGDRARLAAPVDNRLFFAGEATSPKFFSTAHGARDSGERAAQEVLEFAFKGTGGLQAFRQTVR